MAIGERVSRYPAGVFLRSSPRLAGRTGAATFWLRFPVVLFLVAAALRVVSVLVFYVGSEVTGHHGIVSPHDSASFDAWGWYVAQNLRHGHWVNIAPANLAGTYDVGFQYWVGILYFVFGRHTEVVRIIDATLAGFAAPAVYLAARSGNVGESVARRAGWLMACWPLTLFWAGSDMLKDPLAWFFIALAMVAIASRRRFVFVALGVISASLIFVVRSYIGAGLLLLLPVAALIRKDFRAVAAFVALLAAAQFGILALHIHPPAWDLKPYVGNGQALNAAKPVPGSLRALVDPTGAATASIEGPGTNFLQVLRHPSLHTAARLVVGVATTVLGPRLSWHDVVHPTLDTGMYPGLIAWIALIPFTALGLWRGFRSRDPNLRTYGLLSLGLWIVLSFALVTGFREREMAFPATLIFTSLGLRRPWPRYWLVTYTVIIGVGSAILILRESGVI